ncbi:MAG: tetratricopeptide repeat protein [Desulfuromonadaceae bacterium]
MSNPPTETKFKLAISGPAKDSFVERAVSWTFWGILAVLLIVYCGRAITDPDFWWHLKSGEVMLDQGRLLDTDPFNYTGDPAANGRAAAIRILKGYWLWQVAAALLHRVWGFYGIFALKFLTLLLLTGSILWEMRRQSVSPFLQKLLFGLGSVIFVVVFNLERPQVFSFIFAALLLGMVAQVRLGQQPSWLLPPLMVVWSNIHGGFIVGDILLVLFAAGATIQYRTDHIRLKRLLCWAAAGIAASLLNPTGWNVFIEVSSFTQQNATNQIDEFKNSWAHFKDVKLVGLLWFIAGLHVVGLIFTRRKFWPEIFISVFLIGFGLKYLRNEGFIALSLLPMTGWYLGQTGVRKKFTQTRLWQSGALVVVIALLAWLTTLEWDNRKNGWPVSDYYPEKMSLFLQDSGLSGRLFNEYDTGGYFNWALYPKWQTFIDGRGLDSRVNDHFNEIIEARKNHAVLLDQYKIDVVALNIRTFGGRPMPLLKVLLNNPGWIPVYLDTKYFVLARNTEPNSSAIKRFGIDKKIFIDRILALYNDYVAAFPENVKVAICYTELLIYAGKYSEAEVMLARIVQMQPQTEFIPFFRRQIDILNVKQH